MIPPQAVEAAHDQLEAMGAYVSRDYVEAALEAAAPHMLAAAWDEGREATIEAYDGRGDGSNPYRIPR